MSLSFGGSNWIIMQKNPFYFLYDWSKTLVQADVGWYVDSK